MNKFLLAVSLLLSPVAVVAQATIPVTGQKVVDNNLHPLTGQLLFTVTDATDTPITYTPQGGSPTTATITIPVVAGAVQNVGGFPAQIPNPATMSPADSLYRLQVQTTGGGTTYFTFPLVSITQAFFSYDGYAVPAGVTASGMGLPKLPCSPHAQYNNTLASDPYPWVCSLFPGGNGVYWTQNPSLNPSCSQGNNQAIASSLTGAVFCIDASQAFVTPGFVWAGPAAGSRPSQIGLVPITSLCANGACGSGSLNPGLNTQLVNYPSDGTAGGPTSITTDIATRKNLNVPRIFTGQITNGALNSDTYASGAGNNGITNALGSPDCSNGCFFARPQTSTDTENINSALNSGATIYVHGQDGQYGLNQQYFKNVGLSSGSVREARRNTFLFNDSPTNPYIKENGLVNYYTMATPGTYAVGSPMGSHMHDDEMWTYGRSISSLSGANIYAYHVGDAFDAYHYFHYRGGCVQGNDECVKGIDRQLIEEAAPFGTVTSGGHGATTVTLNYTGNAGNQGDGYYLLDTSQVLASGLLVSTTNATPPALDTMTTSDTHAVSNAWGTISATCGAQTPRNAPASATCSLSGITGTFSAAAGSTVCIADPGGTEQAKLTAVGSGTITANLAFSHPVGVPVYQGGLCGGMAAPGYGNTNPASTSQIQAYWVAGSKTSTSFDYLVAFKGGQQGNPPIDIPGLPSLALTNLVRTGNVVTATVFTGAGYQYNNLTAPGASSLVISGATDFNGTITNPTYNGATGTISFTQAGINETAGSATLTLTNYNNYVMYAGAETVAPPPVTLQSSGPPLVGNTLQLEANQGNWGAGDSFIQENSIAQNDALTDFTGSGYTYPLGQPDNAHTTTLFGKKWSSAIYFNLQTSDAASMFQGQGGFWGPRHVMKSTDYLSDLFNFAYAPMNGGYVFGFGCPVGGCVSTAASYPLFVDNGFGGQGQFRYNPGNNTYSFNTGTYSATYLGAQTAVGIGGALGTTFIPPGTAGFGGYLTAVGDSVATSSQMNLCVGNGAVGNCDGTIGSTTSYSANVVAGVKPVSGVSIFQGGTPGTTTYTYACVVRTANGTTQAVTGTTNTGPATLTTTDYNTPKCFGVPGGSTIDIYRTVGGATQGKIGSEANSAENNNIHFKDTGLVGDGSTPPGVNTTGKFTLYGASDGCATFASNVLGSTGTPCSSGSSLPSGTTNQMLYYAGAGTTVTPLTLGTNLSITSGVLNASATAATNFNALTSGTNVTAAMTVGTGASLAATGTGTIAATSAPYSGLTGSAPTWNQNTSGTAANLSGTPALPNGTTATTQTVGDNTTKLATTAFVLANGSSYTLPQATTSVLGGVKCDGTTITCTSGVIAAVSGGSGNTTSTSLTTNTLPKANGANSIVNSAVSDDGTAVTSTEPIAAPGYSTIGTTNGLFGLTAKGSAPSTLPASTVQIEAPNTVTAYHFVLPGAIPTASGQYMTCTNANPSVCSWGVPPGTGGSVTFPWPCQTGLGDGLNAIPAGTYPQTFCYNNTGQTITVTGIKCYADAGTPTMNVTNGAGTSLLTGAITCSSSFAAGTQSATVTLAAGDYLKFSFVASGTAKQATFVVTGTHP